MTDYERLASHVIARRIELGFRTRRAFADTSSLSLRTISDIETARADSYFSSTLATLEHELDWTPGSAERILAGDEPQPSRTEMDLPADEATRLVLDSDLPPDVQSRLVEVLAADRAAADWRRVDLAQSLLKAFRD